jgi:sugar phosphate isomerase/epimerase
MGIHIGVNLDFIRREDKPFAAGVELAAQIGFRYVEPMVHNGRELLSEAGYYHSISMDEDPLEIKSILDRHGVKPSGLSAHSPLVRPEISVPYLQKAIRFAAALGAPIVNTDEGIVPEWLSLEEAYTIMRYTLTSVLHVAERYGTLVGIEPHQSITRRTPGLLYVATLVDSPMLKINYNPGDVYLCGEDPYEGLRTVGHLVAHLRAKDISVQQAGAERGKIAGISSGCACGDGVIDWAKIVSILRSARFRGVISVQCGAPDQAARSLGHLQSVLSKPEEAVHAP